MPADLSSARRIRAVLQQLDASLGRRLSHAEFGELVGKTEGRTAWPKHSVSRWLSGSRIPRAPTRAAIASLVGRSLDAFDEWEPTSPDAWRSATLPPELFSSGALAWLHRFLGDLSELGATPAELRAAEAVLTSRGLATFAWSEPQGFDAAGEAGTSRGIPEEAIIRLWAPIAEVLRSSTAARHKTRLQAASSRQGSS